MINDISQEFFLFYGIAFATLCENILWEEFLILNQFLFCTISVIANPKMALKSIFLLFPWCYIFVLIYLIKLDFKNNLTMSSLKFNLTSEYDFSVIF